MTAPRLLMKVRYLGCAPMYGKCRLHSNGQSKSYYDVIEWGGEEGGGIFSPFTADKQKKNLPLSDYVVIFIFCQYSVLRYMRIITSIAIKTKCPYIGAHPEYLTVINNLGLKIYSARYLFSNFQPRW